MRERERESPSATTCGLSSFSYTDVYTNNARNSFVRVIVYTLLHLDKTVMLLLYFVSLQGGKAPQYKTQHHLLWPGFYVMDFYKIWVSTPRRLLLAGKAVSSNTSYFKER